MKNQDEAALIAAHIRTHGYTRIEKATKHAPTARTRGQVLQNVRKATIKRMADASDRALHQARHIKARLLELAGPSPERQAKINAVKTIAAEMGINTDTVNCRLRKLSEIEESATVLAVIPVGQAVPAVAAPKHLTLFDVVAWIKGEGMDVESAGPGRFLVNGRMSLTAEMLIEIANKRRKSAGMSLFSSSLADGSHV